MRGVALRGLPVAAMLLAVLPATGDDRVLDREHSTRYFEIEPGRRVALIVDNVFGRVHVRSHTEPGVRLELTRTIFGSSDRDLRRALDEVSLDVTQDPKRIELYVDGPFRVRYRDWSHVWRDRGYRVVYDFDLKVPTGVDLSVATVDGGDVRISGLRGDFEVENVNGGIEMVGVAGSGSARTVNGPVHVEFDRNPTADSHFETVNGDVEIHFPSGLTAELELRTTFGELWSEFEVEPLPSRPPTETIENGRRVIRTDAGARVRIGGGGPSHYFETLNGDVLIRMRDRTADMEEAS